ncbi:hypothetical protein Ancab_023530 [Ancistrocladus abbreviatus]
MDPHQPVKRLAFTFIGLCPIYIYHVQTSHFKQTLLKCLVGPRILSNTAEPLSTCHLCVWSMEGWEKLSHIYLQIPSGQAVTPLADTRVQFHRDQIHLLAVHETQIAIYEAPKLECLR